MTVRKRASERGPLRTVMALATSPVRMPAAYFSGAEPPIDVDALFDDTMKRFPKTMARLAE